MGVLGHGGHYHAPASGAPDASEGIDDRGYMEKHMSQEHHIDNFDMESFFHLHDLDQDGYLTIPELEAIYGLHHPHATKDTPEDHMESKRKIIIDKVLKQLDKNGDGIVSKEEFLAGGVDGLPSFVSFPDLGHHYDEESEYFLHHEELYHSTPETQTDESYNHPEGHAHIEAEEDDRERKFKGLQEGEELDTDRAIEDPLDEHAHGSQDPVVANDSENGDQQVFMPTAAGILPRRPDGSSQSRPARIDRSKPDLSGKADLNNWAKEAKGRPGYGENDFHRPRNAEDRLRKGVPYKYKFRGRNEF
ncbi:hypothetical protein QFC24_004792 [Naganishia onofrii]|uniref:Uncharacterized protein n=1 Tax=Naganishia onofrii TaxID=1851511 RepID=A0ACC2XAR5_9TREE|nr:hypothetical protein QFC24_004792 [Naganishia onofrii]